MLVTVSLRPGEVHFDVGGRHRKYLTIETPSAFEIEYHCGKLAIEVKEQTLSLNWGPSEEPQPHIPITVTYRRADDSLYYPEILIPLPGYVQTTRTD